MQEEESVSKLLFKTSSDFKFIAAYQAYVKCFESATKDEQRKALNEAISHLYEKKMSYSNFYREINRFSEDSGNVSDFKRAQIKGQRKREYQRKEQKKERIKRHKN